MGVISKIFKVLSNILYILILAYAIVAFPIVLGYKPLVVLSGSMEPTYKTGSVIYYKKTDVKNIQPQDIITYEIEGGTLVTHRVVGITTEGYITKGDANNMNDIKPISYDKVKGKTTKYYIPYAGYLIRYISNHLYIVGLIVGILIIDFVLSNLEVDEEKKDKEIKIKRAKVKE